MKKTIAVFAMVILTFALGRALSANDSEVSAVEASEAWLKLVDGREYAESWRQGAEHFRNAVTAEQWIDSMKSFRKPLGDVISRRLLSKEYTKSLPGAPDGEYVVIHYHTSFEMKNSAIETVTPMMDTDGKWRVSGYFIK